MMRENLHKSLSCVELDANILNVCGELKDA